MVAQGSLCEADRSPEHQSPHAVLSGQYCGGQVLGLVCLLEAVHSTGAPTLPLNSSLLQPSQPHALYLNYQLTLTIPPFSSPSNPQGKGLIFVNDVSGCYKLKLFLQQFHIPCAVLNSELPLNNRVHIIEVRESTVYGV
ncbi:hypothetical protein EON65_31965 [archaeon]|nr:MAG: hypothetical protein EON65_31965 [archaeon]